MNKCCGENTIITLEESLAYLRTLANFSGTLVQSKELAQRGVEKVGNILGEEHETEQE